MFVVLYKLTAFQATQVRNLTKAGCACVNSPVSMLVQQVCWFVAYLRITVLVSCSIGLPQFSVLKNTILFFFKFTHKCYFVFPVIAQLKWGMVMIMAVLVSNTILSSDL